MWKVPIRRAAFVVVLLTANPLLFLCAGLLQRNFSPQSPSTFGAVLTTAIHGASWAPYFLLSIWIAGRNDWWRNLSGWGRLTSYLLATVYGVALTVPFQYSFVDAEMDGWSITFSPDAFPFNWPGLDPKHYSFSALCLLGILFSVWILLPVFKFSRFTLLDCEQSRKASATVSIAAMMWWTVIAAFIVAIIQFLTFARGELTTSFHGRSVNDAVRLFAIFYAPWFAISALMAFIIAWGWSGRAWLALSVLVVAVPLNATSSQLAVPLHAFGEDLRSNFGELTTLDQWSYVVGEVTMMWLGFGIARLLGVQLKRGELAEPNSKGTR